MHTEEEENEKRNVVGCCLVPEVKGYSKISGWVWLYFEVSCFLGCSQVTKLLDCRSLSNWQATDTRIGYSRTSDRSLSRISIKRARLLRKRIYHELLEMIRDPSLKRYHSVDWERIDDYYCQPGFPPVSPSSCQSPWWASSERPSVLAATEAAWPRSAACFSTSVVCIQYNIRKTSRCNAIQ